MRLNKKIVLTLCLGLLVLSCGKESKVKEQEIKQEQTINEIDFKIEDVRNRKKGNFYTFDISLPQITNEVTKDITYFNLNMKEKEKNILNNIAKSKDSEGIQEAKLWYEIKENSFDILSVVINSYIYEGGAHGVTEITSMNISKKDGLLVDYRRMFNQDATQFFNRAINDKIDKKEKVLNLNGDEFIFFRDAEADVKDATMYFEGDNVVFVFQQYILGPYSSGIPVFKFNKAEISKYMIK